MGGKCRRLVVLLFSLWMTLALASCSGNAGGQEGAGAANVSSGVDQVEGEITMQEADTDLVYIAENLELTLPESSTYVQYGLYENCIYYADGQEIVYYSPADKSTTTKAMEWTDAPGEWHFNWVVHGGEDCIYAEVAVRGMTNLIQYLCKFDGEGKLIFSQELTDYFNEAGENWSSSCRLEVGADGCLYLSGRSFVWIFDEHGSYKGNVSFQNVQGLLVKDLKKSREGKLYVLYENSANGNAYVAEINNAGGKSQAAQKTPSLVGIAAGEQTYLTFDTTTAYSYDRAALTMTPLFDWAACNIDGSYIYFVQPLEDGRIFAASFNLGGKSETFLIRGMTAEEAAALQPEKVEITLVTLVEPSQNLKTAVVYFNRQSDAYTVTVKNYVAEESVTVGLNRLNSEIAAEKGPDLLHLSYLNVESLVEKGYFENLYDYLEKSTVLSASDFLDVSLERYNVDGVLVGIPQNIALQLYLGRKSVVGEGPGWTLEEMLDIVEAYGDEAIYAQDVTKRGVLIDMIRLNEAYFIDRATKQCDFDNELFQRMLQFAARFPDEYEGWYEGKTSEYTNIESGNGFLLSTLVSEFRDLQVYSAAYDGDMTCIGYPMDEGIGCLASPYDAFGISSQSRCKEGAWAFLEYYLQYVDINSVTASVAQFPSYEPSLAKVANRAMTDSRSSVRRNSDGWTYQFHSSTQEEIDQVYELLEASQAYAGIDVNMMDIIEEEAGSYFAGDKSLEEVAKIIQNRIQLYMDEKW